MQRHLRPGRRRAFTLLELLVVLVLLGLSATVILPSLRLPIASAVLASPIQRARAIAVRRGEAVRLEFDADGRWTVRATADSAHHLLLAGDGAEAPVADAVVISALGACLPDASAPTDAPRWDPARCAPAHR